MLNKTMQNVFKKLYMHEYEILAEELCDKLYFHDLSDSSVYTNSMLLSACYGINHDNEDYSGYVGVTTQEMQSWLNGNNVWLTFGSYNNSNELIGNIIINACKKLNIKYEWENNAHIKIHIFSKPQNKPYFYGGSGILENI